MISRLFLKEQRRTKGDAVPWSRQVEEKLKMLVHTLKGFRRIVQKKVGKGELPGLEHMVEALTEQLKDGLGYLDRPKFLIVAATNRDRVLNLIRRYLLDLWYLILGCIDHFPVPLLRVACQCLIAFTRRTEFSIQMLQLDEFAKPHVPREVVTIASRYRELVIDTQVYIQRTLSKYWEKDVEPPFQHLTLAGRVMAQTWFRLPPVGMRVLSALHLDEEEREILKEVERMTLPKMFYGDSEDEQAKKQEKREEEEAMEHVRQNRARRNSLDEYMILGGSTRQFHRKSKVNLGIVTTQLQSRYPELFSWNIFHAVVLEVYPEERPGLLRKFPEWSGFIASRRPLMFVLISEWIHYIEAHVMAKLEPHEWAAFPGFAVVKEALLVGMQKATILNQHAMDASRAMIQCKPSIINLYMSIVFKKVSIYDPMSVLDGLNRLEAWFGEFKVRRMSLPAGFDVEYFCRGLDIIIRTWHHQNISRVLTLLYNFADLLVAETRWYVFGTFLIQQHFFNLFLHWEVNVRNVFHQILIYRMVRIKRSELRNEGFSVPNLAKDYEGENGTLPKVELDESERILDIALYHKLESYVGILRKQVQGQTSSNAFPRDLEVYVPKALSEYSTYMSQYYQWESSNSTDPPRICPLSLLHTKQRDPNTVFRAMVTAAKKEREEV